MAATPQEAAHLLAYCSTQFQRLIGTVSALLAIGVITTGLRLYARWFSGKNAFGWDDISACLTLVALIPQAVLLICISNAFLRGMDLQQ